MNSTSPDSSSHSSSARDQLSDDAQKALDAFLLALALMLKGEAQPMVDLLMKLWTPVFTLIDHEGIKAIAERLRSEFQGEGEEDDVDPLGAAKALRDFVREATGNAALSSEDAFKILHMSGFHEDYQIPDPPEHPLARLFDQIGDLALKYGSAKLAQDFIGEKPKPTVRRAQPGQQSPNAPRPTPVAYEEQHCLHCLTRRRDHAADGCQRFMEFDDLPRTSTSPGRTTEASAVPEVEVDVAVSVQALTVLARNGMISPEGQVDPEFWKNIQELIDAENAASAKPEADPTPES
jgi:hypothetical protein